MNDPDMVTGAVSPQEMAMIDWSEEFQPANHALKFRIDPEAKVVFDYHNGKPLARVEPGYRWYWFHSHLHICPETYDLNANQQNDLRMQGHQDAKDRGKASVLTRVGKAIGLLASAEEKCDSPQKEQIRRCKEVVNKLMISLKEPFIPGPVEHTTEASKETIS